jgi:hypothetical protein
MAEAPAWPGKGWGMHIVLLALGLVVLVAGMGLIALGLPISTGGLGHTLVVAGTIAAVGSLILSSLATTIRQLRRIAQVLEARPRAPAPEPEEARVAAPSRAPAIEPAFAPEAEPRIEPTIEPVAEPPPREAAAAPVPAAAEPPPPEPADEPAPLAPKPEPEKTFDDVWSGGRERPARAAEATVASVGVAVVEAVRPERAPEPALPEPEPVRIFKSGVIDGMAYTLYTDGSIEAELPQGTVKFASIDELRAYLTARE